ncbi:Uncharacterised protein [Mycobacteroides abscessus subsp. abscessus]|nr:Uncharacterised protein [Mycobacteroides abscessus subsp. abscessus]
MNTTVCVPRGGRSELYSVGFMLNWAVVLRAPPDLAALTKTSRVLATYSAIDF